MDLRAIVVSALMTATPLVAAAGVNTWTSVGPAGGEVVKVAYNRSTPTTIYMIATAGILRSQDEGATWQLVKSDFFNAPSDLDVDPTDQNRVYVVSPSPETLQVSTDAGATFSPITSFVTSFPTVGNIYQLAVGADGSTLYAASGLRIFRSSDRGAHWEERTALGNGLGVPAQMLADPSDPKTVYAILRGTGISNSLVVTHDGAGSWTELPAAAANAGYLRDIAIHASNPARLWIAGDNGVFVSSNSGTNFSLDSPPGALGISAIAINPADAKNLFLANSYGHLYSTTDEGVTWMEITGNVTAGQATTIAVTPAQGTPHVLVGGFGGLSLNTSGGNVWTPRQTGFLGTRITSFSADATSDRLYIGALSAGLHYLASGADSATSVDNSQLRSLSFTPATFYVPAVLAQDGTPGRLFASLDNQIARSLNGGSSWALTGFPLAPAQQVRSLTSSPANPQVILAGALNSVFRSANGGDSWTSSTTGFPVGAFADLVQFASSDPLVAYAAPQVFSGLTNQAFGLYRSADAGQSWSPVNTGIANLGIVALAVDPTDAQTVYISADSKIWRSTNGGSSWAALSWESSAWGYPSALAVDPLHPQILYATGPATVARSINRGDSWELLRQPQALPFWVPSAILPDPNRPHVLLVGTQNSGAQQMTIAPDLTLTLDPTADLLQVGMPVAYHYTLSNIGPFHATGVKLTLDVPATAQDVKVAPSVGACTTSGHTLTCSLDAVRAGFNATVTLSATAAQTGPFHVGATVQADQPDAVPANNTQNRDATVAQLSDVSVSATGPASAKMGDALTYTLTVSNAGPNLAGAVQLTYELASGLTAGAASSDKGSCNVALRLVTCAVGDLMVASAATITVQVTAASTGDQISTARLTTTSTDSVSANDTRSVVTSVTAAASASSGTSGGGGRLSPLVLLFLGLMLTAKIRADARRLRALHT